MSVLVVLFSLASTYEKNKTTRTHLDSEHSQHITTPWALMD